MATHLDLLREQRRFEVALDDDLDLHLLAPDLAHERDDAEREADVLRRAVPVIGAGAVRIRDELRDIAE